MAMNSQQITKSKLFNIAINMSLAYLINSNTLRLAAVLVLLVNGHISHGESTPVRLLKKSSPDRY